MPSFQLSNGTKQHFFGYFKARATRCNFFPQLSADNSPVNDDFFFVPCICCDFSACLCRWFEVWRKIKLIKIIFRWNSVSPCRMWMQLYLILAVLLPIFTHFTVILHGHVVCSPQKRAEKKSQRSTWTQPHLFQCNLFLLWNCPQILAEKIAVCSCNLRHVNSTWECSSCDLEGQTNSLCSSL